MYVDHYHGHQEYSNRPKTPNSLLGFDLSLEQAHINQEGDRYHFEFLHNAEFFAKETYGKAPAVPYIHEVVVMSNGEVRLKMPQRDMLARESYEQGKKNPKHPNWLKERAEKDLQWIISLEEHLQHAKLGDIFIDASPTAFDIPLKDREKFMFGNHSFLRIHQYVEENGAKILKSIALLHYLDAKQQTELYNWLTKQGLEAHQLLGNVAPLQERLGIANVDDIEQVRALLSLINSLYIRNPIEKRLPQDLQIDDKELNKHLNTLRPWLEKIFYMMRRQVSRRQIELEFHGWENAFRARVLGEYDPAEDIHFQNMRQYMSGELQSIVNAPIDLNTPFQHLINFMNRYMSQEYKPAANMCGGGSGYGDDGTTDIVTIPNRLSGPMDYQMMTKNFYTYIYSNDDIYKKLNMPNQRRESYVCPGCFTIIPGELYGVDQSKWRTHCPKPDCRFEFRCAENVN